MPLVFLPDIERLFLWGADAQQIDVAALGSAGTAHVAPLLTPVGLESVTGVSLPLLDTTLRRSSLVSLRRPWLICHPPWLSGRSAANSRWS
jgi:hypothetical protein